MRRMCGSLSSWSSARSLKRAAALMLVSIFMGVGVGGSRLSGQPTVTGERVTLDGAGSDSVRALMGEGASAVYDSPSGVDYTYLALGDRSGREALVEGKVDFAVSGRPVSEEESKTLNGKELISIPISVGASAFLVHLPHDNGFRTYVLDPLDPESVTFGEYSGPFRIPNDLLARVILEKVTQFWAEPGFTQAIKLGEWHFVAAGPLIPFVSSAPGASSYYLQRFVQQNAPQDWTDKARELLVPEAEVSEAWPFLTTPSRPGSQDVSGILAAGHGPQGSGGPFPPGGTVAPVVPADAKEWLEKGDPQLLLAHVQNGSGEWVLPTPEAISRAAELGESDRLPALDKPVSGAYPLVWINRLYVQAEGLTRDKVNAIASLVRWTVTAGQETQAAHGEGRLPESLVEEALASANELVEGNCKGEGQTVVEVGDGGPYWPKATEAGKDSKLCSGAGGSTPEGESGGYAGSPFGGYSTSPLGSALAGVASGASGGGTAGDGDDDSPGTTPVAMPLPMPSDGFGGFDRVATALVGVLAWVVIAPPIMRRFRRGP